MHISKLFSLEELELELQDGYVKEQKHPLFPLTILNYTDKATYEQRWSNVTLHCRGLILNSTTHEVIARGPRKFFNYGEPSATEYPLDTRVRVSTKEDGSLGIGWVYEHEADDVWEYGYSTRGSFTSEQAVWANKHIREEGTTRLAMLPDILSNYASGAVYGVSGTFGRYNRPCSDIVEIVYPENRIVLDYNGRKDLIPLGMVDNETGLIVWRAGDEKDISLAEALALPIADDAEGYVLDILDADGNVIDHLKLKGERYKFLHAAIFGLSAKAIWEHCQNGTIREFITALPDEVQPWANAEWSKINKDFDRLWYRVLRAHNDVYKLGIGWTRKQAAERLKAEWPDVMSPVFNMLDGKDARRTEWIWKQIKPGHVPFSSATKELVEA